MRAPLHVAPAPHVLSGAATETIMRDVVVALAPATAFAVWLFGLSAALVIVVAVASCLTAEYLVGRVRGDPGTLGDGSAAVTGLLYGLTLPPSLPLWMTAAGGLVAIGLGKAVFGGLGANVFNPALVGRAFLQAAFPTAMTSWQAPLAGERFVTLAPSTLAPPFGIPVWDGLTGATPLAAMKFERVPTPLTDFFIGSTAGSLGETSALLLLAGGVWLVARRALHWRTPVAVLGTAGLACALAHGIDPERYAGPGLMLLSGSLVLGAVYMATDPVGSPITPVGCWLHGVLVGGLVVVIRYWGGLPEGVMYAVLIGNATVPLLDRWVRPVRPRPERRGSGG